MKKITDPIIVKCFCDKNNKSGNPAAVYIDQLFNDDQKQQIASQLNLPVTVFVENSKSDFPSIEFFYPNRKMPLCLHGTLAAAYVLFENSKRSNITMRTFSGRLLRFKNSANHFEVEVSSEKVEQPSLSLMLCSELLNMDISNIEKGLPFAVASVGSPKLLIPVTSSEILSNLNPNYSHIEKWSLENKVNGVYVYCNNVAADIFYARGFNPITGHQEDAATGVAAAALSFQLGRSIAVKQGRELGMPCRMDIRFISEGSIWVGGKSVCLHRRKNP